MKNWSFMIIYHSCMNQPILQVIILILPWIAASPRSSCRFSCGGAYLPQQMPGTRYTAGWAGIIILLLKETDYIQVDQLELLK